MERSLLEQGLAMQAASIGKACPRCYGFGREPGRVPGTDPADGEISDEPCRLCGGQALPRPLQRQAW